MEQSENGNSSDTRNNPQTPLSVEAVVMAFAGHHTSHSFGLDGIRPHGLLGYQAWCQKSKSRGGGRHSQRDKKVKSTLTYDVVPRIVKQMTE